MRFFGEEMVELEGMFGGYENSELRVAIVLILQQNIGILFE